MKNTFTLFTSVLFSIVISAQAPSILWQKSVGGSGGDQAICIIRTSDDGYVFTGNSQTGSNSPEYWVVKLNSSGVVQWQQLLGRGTAYSITQSFDSGYVVVGVASFTTGNHGQGDYWVLKLDSYGNIQWQKSLGGSSVDHAESVIQTIDSGFIVAGYSNSNDGDVTGNHGLSDYWIVKLNSDGTIQWQKSLGGSGNDNAYSII